MSDSRCKICGCETYVVFSAKMLATYDTRFHHCKNCGFLQTDDPYWLDKSYRAPINVSDTGILSRNLHLSSLTGAVLYFFFNRRARYVDYAGGYGILTRLMRDMGFDFYWCDLYAENLFARGFEQKEGEKAEAVTCYEAFEHFVHPLQELETMLSISKNILFSTVLVPSPVPAPDQWWYYGLEHGQHVSFYSSATLQFIAKKYGLHLLTSRSFHLLSQKNISRLSYRIATKLSALGLSAYVKRMMKSKTFNDMKSLVCKKAAELS